MTFEMGLCTFRQACLLDSLQLKMWATWDTKPAARGSFLLLYLYKLQSVRSKAPALHVANQDEHPGPSHDSGLSFRPVSDWPSRVVTPLREVKSSLTGGAPPSAATEGEGRGGPSGGVLPSTSATAAVRGSSVVAAAPSSSPGPWEAKAT